MFTKKRISYVITAIVSLCIFATTMSGCSDEDAKVTFVTRQDGTFTMAYSDIKDCIKRHPKQFRDAGKFEKR